MSDTYTPPKIWKPAPAEGRFAAINRPVSGATHDKELPVGKHPHQLYSLATPNGVKVTVLFEELLALGIEEAEYDAWIVNIMEGDQFGSGFVAVNPNSKIPALMDHSTPAPTRVFESGAILLYLAEKFDRFLGSNRPEMLSWLMWQMGSAPYLGGGFGHFYAYAPEKWEYPINRFTMEVKRQLDVLDQRLSANHFLTGDDYTIADMANYAWYGQLALGRLYEAGEFLDVESYKNVRRWAEEIDAREPVSRGRMVNRATGNPSFQLRERHDAGDFETRTWDKIGPKDEEQG